MGDGLRYCECGRVIPYMPGQRQTLCPKCRKRQEKEAKAEKTVTIVCKRCGKTVVTSAKGPERQYCDACAHERRKERQKAWREEKAAKKPPRVRKGRGTVRVGECTRCGVTFEYIYKGYERICCDDCLRGGVRNLVTRPTRVSQIDDLAAAARAAGMSYGRYKAMMEYKKAHTGA